MRSGAQSTREFRPALIALAVTVVVHAVLGAWLSEPLAFAVRVLAVPAKVAVRPLSIPESKLPASMRLAEVSPAGNREIPPEAPQVAARNQRAAQPVPEMSPTRSALPRSAGESPDTLRLAQAMPRSIDAAVAPEPRPEAGTPKVGLGPAVSATPPQPRPVVATPRASLPTGTSGLLLRNPVGVGRAGAVALDARFSSYGDYAQRMLEAVQGSWWSLLERAHFDDFAAGHVVVRFRIHRDGTVSDARVVSSTVPLLAGLACKDAVMLPAPYDIWRADMVAMLGESEEVTITFHYR